MTSTSLSDQHKESHDEPSDSQNIEQVAFSANEEQIDTSNNNHSEREVSLPGASLEQDAIANSDTLDVKSFDSEMPNVNFSEHQLDPVANNIDPQNTENVITEHVEQAHIMEHINPSSESVCSVATLVYQDEVGGNFDQDYPAYLAPTKAFMAKRREPVKVAHQNPFRFPRHPNSEPERYEEPQEPYVPLAVRIRQTALRTPSRFRRRPDPVSEAPPRRVCLPQTPVLTSRYRTRATRSVEPSSTVYRANPVDRKALDSRGEIGVPRLKRRLPTIPHSPAFSSKRQRYQQLSDSDPTTALNNVQEVSNFETLEQEALSSNSVENQAVSIGSNMAGTEISNATDETC